MAKNAPKKGRPPVQHIKHHIIIPEETLAFLDNLMERWTIGKAIRAAGEAGKGILSHPAGLLTVTGMVAAALFAFAPKPEGETDDQRKKRQESFEEAVWKWGAVMLPGSEFLPEEAGSIIAAGWKRMRELLGF